MNIIESPEHYAILPQPLAEAVAELATESTVHGEQTTADELADLIEAFFSTIGRYSIAEYLHLGAPDPNINELLYQSLSRNVTVGLWIYLSVSIQKYFHQHNKKPLTQGLDKIDFGTPDDQAHRVTKLLAYRNAFSHGSMGATLADIQTHRALMEEMLQECRFFWEQPILVNSQDNKTWQANDQLYEGQAASEVTAGQPYLLSAQGAALNLYPFLYATETDPPQMRFGSLKSKEHSLMQVFQSAAIYTWYEKYQQEINGHLDFTSLRADLNASETPPSIQTAISNALGSDQNTLVLVEAFPGFSGKNALAFIAEKHQAALYFIEPGRISHSARVFCNFLLRQCEAQLNLAENTYSIEKNHWQQALQKASADLEAAGKKLLVGLGLLHDGQEPLRQDQDSILEVFNFLASTAIRVLALSYPGAIYHSVYYDEAIQWFENQDLNQQELSHALVTLQQNQPPLRQKVLHAIANQSQAFDLFSLCESLEKDGSTAFEPGIERELWELRPILKQHDRTADGHYQWQLFHPNLAKLILAGATS